MRRPILLILLRSSRFIPSPVHFNIKTSLLSHSLNLSFDPQISHVRRTHFLLPFPYLNITSLSLSSFRTFTIILSINFPLPSSPDHINHHTVGTLSPNQSLFLQKACPRTNPSFIIPQQIPLPLYFTSLPLYKRLFYRSELSYEAFQPI